MRQSKKFKEKLKRDESNFGANKVFFFNHIKYIQKKVEHDGFRQPTIFFVAATDKQPNG
jgi:hypothetical protein